MKISKKSKILLIPLNGIGDNLAFLPLAYNLKKQLKNIQITILSNQTNGASEIMRFSPYVDKIVKFNFRGNVYTFKEYVKFYIWEFWKISSKLKKENFDYLFTINPNFLIKTFIFLLNIKNTIQIKNKEENQNQTILKLLDKVQISQIYAPKNLLKLPDETKILQKHKLHKKKYIVINPYGSIKTKGIKINKAFLMDVQKINPELQIVIIGKEKDHIKLKKVIDVVNQTSLAEAGKIIENAKLFITVDGGLMHLGIAMQVPIIAIFKVIHSKYHLPIDYPVTFKTIDVLDPKQSFSKLGKNIQETYKNDKAILKSILSIIKTKNG
ncbi:glycosyltransferase family 9 protein [Candidatus Pacearchaeota archaeon]|nr:glycosyltransferase family 9 protein [Candidatus Pacearchaeota archaeon]